MKKKLSLGRKIYLFVGITVFVAGIVVAILSYFINASRSNLWKISLKSMGFGKYTHALAK